MTDWPSRTCVVAVLGLAALVYGPGVAGFFVSDDFVLLQIAAQEPISAFAWLRDPTRFAFFRPFPLALWRLDYLCFGLNPSGYHVTNLALHCLNALLVAAIAQRIYRNRTLTLIAAALFVIHPFCPGVCLWISARYDLTATLFMLLAVRAAIEVRLTRSLIGRFVFVIAVVLGLGSKESAIVLPLVLSGLASRTLAKASGLGERLVAFPEVVTAFGVTGAYLIARLVLYQGLGGYGMHSQLHAGQLANSLAALGVAIQPAYGVPPAGGPVWPAVAVAVGAAAALLCLTPLWLTWFLVMPAPALNLMPGFYHAPVRDYERFLYSAVAGLAIGVAALWWRLQKTYPLASAALVMALATGYTAATSANVTDWIEAGRLTRQVHGTLVSQKPAVPQPSTIDCSALPDTIRDAFAHISACDAQIRLIWGNEDVRGVRNNELGRVPGATFALSADGAQLIDLRRKN